jgi:mannan endo-1,4-beta-mannosidase
VCNGTGCLTNCVTSADCFGTNKCFAAICGGLKGVYFKLADPSMPSWSGTPAATRIDGNINFPYAGGSPFTPGASFLSNTSPSTADSTFPVDGFTVRWTGTLTPRFTGQYFFEAQSDDGVGLWINDVTGSPVAGIDNPTLKQGGQDHFSGAINLMANQPVNIRVDYYENTGEAHVVLLWSNTQETGGSFTVINTARLTPAP